MPPDADAPDRPAGAASTDAALRRVLDAAGVPAATLDTEGRLSAVNPAFARACGRAVGELVGLHVLSLCPGRDQAELLGAVVHLVGGVSRIERADLHVVAGDGSVRELVLTLGTAVDGTGRPVAIHAVADDVTERRREERRRESPGPADPVAGALVAVLACRVTARPDGGPVAPAVVAAVAERLRQRVRPGDDVAGPDGAIVQVLARGLGDVQDAAGVAYRLLAAVMEPVRSDGGDHPVDLTIGIAVGSGHEGTGPLAAPAEAALARADGDGPGSFRLADLP